MIRFYTILTFILTLAGIGTLQAQEGMISSYEGRHFYVGFLDNEIHLYQDPYMIIYVSSKFDTEVTVNEPQANRTYTFLLKKDEVSAIEVTRGYEHKQSEFVFDDMLMEITSTQPISCVAKSALRQSCDKFSIIPTRNWGYEHYAVSMPNDYYIEPEDQNPIIIEDQKTPRLGEFLVMARENNTLVDITMTAESFGGVKKDSSFSVVLNRGQSYLVKSKAVHGVKGIHDLSGSRILSNKPVGVVSGHMRTSIKQFEELNALYTKDHLVEMIPPASSWSNEYASVPFGFYIKSMFKVVAKDTITLDVVNELNTNSVELLPGEVHTFDNIEVPTSWVADGKFLLVQFMAKYVPHLYYDRYDPAMVVVPPLNKMVSNVTYFASNSVFAYPDGTFRDQFLQQSVLIIADEKGYQSVEVNGINIETILEFNEFIANGKKLYWEKVHLGASPSTVNIKADSGSFHAIAIGNGGYDSYAMTVGASLIDEANLELESPIIDFVETCSTVEGKVYDRNISANSGINYFEVDRETTVNMQWSISEITDNTFEIDFSAEVINKNRPARINFDVFDYSGNKESYSFEYDGALVYLTNNIDFGEINAKKDSCYNFVLRTEADSVLLESVDLPTDVRLNLSSLLSFPLMLYKGEDYYLSMCLDNEPGNFDAVADSIIFHFACDYSRVVPIRADVISYNLTVSNLILPKILSGTTHISTVEEFIEFRNEGNAEIVVTELEIPANNHFTIDTVGKFPQTLLSGESIRFDNISFTHTDIGQHSIEVKLIDNQSIFRQATIVGEIGAPNINNIVYDFQETRVGTSKDTTFKFVNMGSYSSEFKLVNVESNIDNDENKSLLESNSSILLEELEELELEFVYNPLDINDFTPYLLTATYVERWDGHDTILVKITGQPTLPKISTYDIDLDTIKISSFRDSLHTIIESYGNEDLEIIEIKPIYGDENVFEFDQNFYNQRTLPKGETEQLSIRFNGLSLGYHEMKLLVESDALPNYERKLDTILIYGFVEALDTLDADILADNILIQSCNYDTLDLTITNTGNTRFIINDITPNIAEGSVRILPIPNKDTVDISESIIRKVEVFLSGNKTMKVDYAIDLHDIDQSLDTTLYYQNEVESKQESITINPFDVNTLEIGDYFDLRFSGVFPNYIDTTTNIKFELKIDIFQFFTEDKQTTITFFDKYGEEIKKVDCELLKNDNTILIESAELETFDFDEVVSWSFELRFQTMLTADLESEVELNIVLDDCYTSNSRKVVLNIEEVCVFNYRNVILNSIISDISLSKNVISDELEIDVVSTEEIEASVYVLDMGGKKYNVINKLMFDKGKNNIILNLSDYANGKYILIIDSQSSISKQEFIITK